MKNSFYDNLFVIPGENTPVICFNKEDGFHIMNNIENYKKACICRYQTFDILKLSLNDEGKSSFSRPYNVLVMHGNDGILRVTLLNPHMDFNLLPNFVFSIENVCKVYDDAPLFVNEILRLPEGLDYLISLIGPNKNNEPAHTYVRFFVETEEYPGSMTAKIATLLTRVLCSFNNIDQAKYYLEHTPMKEWYKPYLFG